MRARATRFAHKLLRGPVTLAAGLSLATLAMGCASGATPQQAKMARAKHDLAADAFHRGQFREALRYVEHGARLDPENGDVTYLGGLTLLVFCANDPKSPDCRWADAEAYMTRTLELQPDRRDAKNALGVIYVHRRKLDDAIGVLEPLSKDIIYHSPEKAWGNLGWAYLEAKRYDDAVAALKRSVAAQPTFCVGHFRLGLAYEAKRQFAAAQQSFSRALSVKEGACGRLQDAFWGRARVLERMGKVASIREDLQRCQDLGGHTRTGKRCARKLQALK